MTWWNDYILPCFGFKANNSIDINTAVKWTAHPISDHNGTTGHIKFIDFEDRTCAGRNESNGQTVAIQRSGIYPAHQATNGNDINVPFVMNQATSFKDLNRPLCTSCHMQIVRNNVDESVPAVRGANSSVGGRLFTSSDNLNFASRPTGGINPSQTTDVSFGIRSLQSMIGRNAMNEPNLANLYSRFSTAPRSSTDYNVYDVPIVPTHNVRLCRSESTERELSKTGLSDFRTPDVLVTANISNGEFNFDKKCVSTTTATTSSGDKPASTFRFAEPVSTALNSVNQRLQLGNRVESTYQSTNISPEKRFMFNMGNCNNTTLPFVKRRIQHDNEINTNGSYNHNVNCGNLPEKYSDTNETYYKICDLENNYLRPILPVTPRINAFNRNTYSSSSSLETAGIKYDSDEEWMESKSRRNQLEKFQFSTKPRSLPKPEPVHLRRPPPYSPSMYKVTPSSKVHEYKEAAGELGLFKVYSSATQNSKFTNKMASKRESPILDENTFKNNTYLSPADLGLNFEDSPTISNSKAENGLTENKEDFRRTYIRPKFPDSNNVSNSEHYRKTISLPKTLDGTINSTSSTRNEVSGGAVSRRPIFSNNYTRKPDVVEITPPAANPNTFDNNKKEEIDPYFNLTFNPVPGNKTVFKTNDTFARFQAMKKYKTPIYHNVDVPSDSDDDHSYLELVDPPKNAVDNMDYFN